VEGIASISPGNVEKKKKGLYVLAKIHKAPSSATGPKFPNKTLYIAEDAKVVSP
jgi:hypothetical protein